MKNTNLWIWFLIVTFLLHDKAFRVIFNSPFFLNCCETKDLKKPLVVSKKSLEGAGIKSRTFLPRVELFSQEFYNCTLSYLISTRKYKYFKEISWKNSYWNFDEYYSKRVNHASLKFSDYYSLIMASGFNYWPIRLVKQNYLFLLHLINYTESLSDHKNFGCGCGAVGRAIVSDTWGLWFKSQHWQLFHIICKYHLFGKAKKEAKKTGCFQ